MSSLSHPRVKCSKEPETLGHGNRGKEVFSMGKSNVGFVCQLCGKPARCPSTMVIQGGYDSAHDLERVVLQVCGVGCQRRRG